ncbi:thiol-disulfide isomerase/thioredoxin [Flavobacterium sp. 103]|uniref:TlpA family protein disulfide reductase n=1 Tax=unclassified Flavobacterium TaxID=196869 RepID=UPI000D5DA996|nr:MULTISPECIES: thioredoxin family protein [unclassified Flavobacterium]PVX46808.1 thiol-disulfide isomerase/thioredoxin [Flavobacterium sp. 103]QKJ64642.1 thioredoxin family protein [Flavobacterium sp. M31R6]
MRRFLLTLIVSLFFTASYCQDTITYLTDAIKENINPYKRASNNAYEKRNIEEGKNLFDSLVKNKLIGTKFDDFSLKVYKEKNVKINRISKPIFIITYASWCVIPKGEIPALNILAKEHRDDMQFIVVFWDKKSDLKNIAYKFSDNIKVCYANEYYSKDTHIVATIKHTLGFPTSIFVDENKYVVNIKHFESKTKIKTPIKEAIITSYNYFSKDINENLMKALTSKKSFTTN